MSVRNWLTKKLTKTVEAVAEPMRNNVETKLNTWSGLWRIGTCIIVGLIMLKEDEKGGLIPPKQEPSSVVINNYINTREETDGR